MRTLIAAVALLAGLTTSSAIAVPLQADWSNGFVFSTEDGQFSLGIGAMVLNDWSWYVSQDDATKTPFGDFQDGTEIRTARFGIIGTMYGNIQYRFQYDFWSGAPTPTFTYVGITGLPVVGTIRMGHMAEPFTMTFNTGPTNLPMMERPLPWVLAPGWNTGILAFNTVANNRVAWALGLFRDTGASGGGTGDNAYAVTGRVNGAVMRNDDATRLVRLGAAFSHRNKPGTVQYRERPESHLAPIMPDTGPITTDAVDLVGGELVTVMGPLSLQAEGIASYVDVPGNSDPVVGYYATVGYFLTGESRPYGSTGIAGRVKPNCNFGSDGMGAFEVLARYSALDLDAAGVTAGMLTTISAGVNWYLNPKTRIMMNYVLGDHDDTGTVSTVQMRFVVEI